MDNINDTTIKNEVNNFLQSLQKFLPKKHDIILVEPNKERIIRLSDIHTEAKNVFPKCFIGTKLVILRAILDRVKIAQQYSFGKPKDSYKCFTQMIHKELETKGSDDGLLIDMNGSATATYRQVVDGAYEMRLTSRIRDLISSETEIVFEKESTKSIGSVCCTMRDVEPSTIRTIAQWMYKVMPDLSFGSEISCKPFSYPLDPAFSISARYDKPSFTLSSTVGKSGFQACLFKKFSPDLSVSTIVNESYRGGPAIFGLALHKECQNGAELKMFVDSQRCGGFTFQRELLFQESPDVIRVVRLVASTLIDRQKRVRFGFGFNLDF